MTRIFDEKGVCHAATVIQAGPCVISQVKVKEKDGYSALQLAFDDKKEKHTTRALRGHFKKSNAGFKRKLAEFKGFEGEYKTGDTISVSIFEVGEWVDVVGTSKGKGFQGVVKRHNFSGVGYKHHGQHDRERAPGSIGNSSYASRVFKGMRMAGRMGGARVKSVNLYVFKVIPDKNLLVVSGSIPGANGNYVLVEKA